jgi:hypothetical protein
LIKSRRFKSGDQHLLDPADVRHLTRPDVLQQILEVLERSGAAT